MKALGAIFGLVVLVVVSAIFNGYVLSLLWGWFVVPVFSLPKLPVTSAIGLSLVVGYLTHQVPEEKTRPFGEMMSRAIALAALKPSLALLFGWILRWFV